MNARVLALVLGILPCLQACSVDSARNHYLLGEKLWTDSQYLAAVSEFEKVTLKDPRGKLGLQAAFRAATTEFLFLSKYPDAIRKLQNFVQWSGDSRLVWEAQVLIGEGFFSKTEQYDQAIQHYRNLLKLRPQATEGAEFLYRIAKSYFFTFQFTDAIDVYEELIQTYPKSPFAEKATYEIGVTYLTLGNDSYESAKKSFEQFIRRYPKSPLVMEARFGIASCLEELDRLDDADAALVGIKEAYPSPGVIEVKLNRIRQRIAQRKVSK